MGTDGFSQLGGKYMCSKCTETEMRKIMRRPKGPKLQ
jgi:hypothetical protein